MEVCFGVVLMVQEYRSDSLQVATGRKRDRGEVARGQGDTKYYKNVKQLYNKSVYHKSVHRKSVYHKSRVRTFQHHFEFEIFGSLVHDPVTDPHAPLRRGRSERTYSVTCRNIYYVVV